MTGAQLTQLLYCFCVLSALLLLGTWLRAVVPAFRKLFLPASVIGGFIGLLIGPIIWGAMGNVEGVFHLGGIPFPKTWIATWASLPGILIVPVVASTPLGMKLKAKGEPGAGKTATTVIKTFAIMFGVVCLQVIIGLVTRQLFVNPPFNMDLYLPFGYELTEGFAGGHGTAGVVGSYYKQLELPYWEVAQGVTTTTATFGLIGGIIIGIAAINVAARKGTTKLLKKPGDLPEDQAKGYQMNEAKQASAGRETMNSSSISSLCFHMAIILVGCGLAYIVMTLVKIYKVPIISQVPIWAYAIVMMFLVNYIIQKLGLGSLVDSKTKGGIAGALSDYAITAAIASMPVQAIASYIVPILFMVIVGYIISFVFIFGLINHFFKGDCPVERSVSAWGTSSGVFLTGLLLLKITDPDLKLPVLNDYSVAFSMFSICGFVLMPLSVQFMLTKSFGTNMLLQSGLTAFCFILLFFADRIAKTLQKSHAA